MIEKSIEHKFWHGVEKLEKEMALNEQLLTLKKNRKRDTSCSYSADFEFDLEKVGSRMSMGLDN